jgi:hypothetical protein
MTNVEHPLKDQKTFGNLMSYEDMLLNNTYDATAVTEIVSIYSVASTAAYLLLRSQK